MMKSIYVASVVGALALASPVYAATDMECTDASMQKMNSDVTAMKDGGDKTMAMNEMKMAQDMMIKKDMQGCMDHMNKAMMGMKK